MLSKIFKNAPKQISTVPDWLVGFWKREYIFDSDGTMDEYSDGTKVVYLQTHSSYIDFRIPDTIISELDNDTFKTSGQSLIDPFNNYTPQLFDLLSTQLCDSGKCIVDFKHKINDQDDIKVADMVHQGHNIITVDKSNTVKDFFTFPIARWMADINYQLHTNYPEPGILTQHETRKDCMYEQPPSNDYLELWRYDTGNKGINIYLELLKETCIDNDNDIKRYHGRLMINGNHFMMVRDRQKNVMDLIKEFDPDSTKLTEKERNGDLRTVIKCMNNIEFSKQLLDTEYSYGKIIGNRNIMDINEIQEMEFEIELSSIPFYVGRRIKLFDETNWKLENEKFLIQTDNDMKVKRFWEIKHLGQTDNQIFIP